MAEKQKTAQKVKVNSDDGSKRAANRRASSNGSVRRGRKIENSSRTLSDKRKKTERSDSRLNSKSKKTDSSAKNAHKTKRAKSDTGIFLKFKSISPGMRKLLVVLVVILVLVILFFSLKRPVLNAFYEHKLNRVVNTGSDTLAEGVTINGLDFSGMKKDEIIDALNETYTLPEGNAITLVNGLDSSKKYDCSYEQLGISYDIEGTVDKAMAFANYDLSDNWFRDFKILESGNVNFTVLKYDYDKIKSFCKSVADDNYVKVSNASVRRDRDKKQFIVALEAVGQRVDEDKLINDVVEKIKNEKFGESVTFEVETVQPEWTADDFMTINNRIGSYSSEYDDSDENRNTNLRNACEKLNGTVLYPDEILSVNDKFNPCTEENGWRMADTIVGGAIEKSVGGGMCQISSALYMAALAAELDIEERYNHSLKVDYMPYATDAALAGDYKDLKIKNNTEKPMFIEAYMDESKVYVKLYGQEIHDDKRTLKFKSKYISTQKPGDPIKKSDPDLPEGTEKVTTEALDGQTYELYKEVYEDGKLVESVKVNTSTYLPRQEVISVGTKKS